MGVLQERGLMIEETSSIIRRSISSTIWPWRRRIGDWSVGRLTRPAQVLVNDIYICDAHPDKGGASTRERAVIARIV